MKVSEIKELLKGYSEKEKDRIIIELYNKIPKGMRKDKDIDYYLQNAHLNKEKEKIAYTYDADFLSELNYFLDCAKEGLYASPNRIISKSERTSWNTKAKKFYKVLVNTDPTTDDGMDATDYLITLFNLLSYGTHTLVFSSWKTFSRINTHQMDYLSMLYKRILINGSTDDALRKCAKLSLIYADADALTRFGIMMLSSVVQEKDDKLKLIEILKEEIANYKKKNPRDSYYVCEYYYGMLYMYFSIQEFAEGIKYYLQSSSDTVESNVCRVLNALEDLEYYDEWVEFYEKYEKKINIRDSLKEKYTNYKAGNYDFDKEKYIFL